MLVYQKAPPLIWVSVRAPGANDDGSGVASLLGISNVIKEHNLTFSNNIEVVAFSGEEQGLVGSSFYAGNTMIQEMPFMSIPLSFIACRF